MKCQHIRSSSAAVRTISVCKAIASVSKTMKLAHQMYVSVKIVRTSPLMLSWELKPCKRRTSKMKGKVAPARNRNVWRSIVSVDKLDLFVQINADVMIVSIRFECTYVDLKFSFEINGACSIWH